MTDFFVPKLVFTSLWHFLLCLYQSILYLQSFIFYPLNHLNSLPIMDIIGRKMKETEGESGKKPTHHRPTGNSKYNKNKSYGLIDYKDRAILD